MKNRNTLQRRLVLETVAGCTITPLRMRFFREISAENSLISKANGVRT